MKNIKEIFSFKKISSKNYVIVLIVSVLVIALTLYGCESSKTNASAFENCKSKFLEEIGKEETVLGMNITAHKSDGISKYTQNKNKTTISVGE